MFYATVFISLNKTCLFSSMSEWPVALMVAVWIVVPFSHCILVIRIPPARFLCRDSMELLSCHRSVERGGGKKIQSHHGHIIKLVVFVSRLHSGQFKWLFLVANVAQSQATDSLITQIFINIMEWPVMVKQWQTNNIMLYFQYKKQTNKKKFSIQYISSVWIFYCLG